MKFNYVQNAVSALLPICVSNQRQIVRLTRPLLLKPYQGFSCNPLFARQQPKTGTGIASEKGGPGHRNLCDRPHEPFCDQVHSPDRKIGLYVTTKLRGQRRGQTLSRLCPGKPIERWYARSSVERHRDFRTESGNGPRPI